MVIDTVLFKDFKVFILLVPHTITMVTVNLISLSLHKNHQRAKRGALRCCQTTFVFLIIELLEIRIIPAINLGIYIHEISTMLLHNIYTLSI